MAEFIIQRVTCLSDGAMAALREDLKDMSDGESKCIAKALDEIEWRRGREVELERKAIDYDLDQAGIESRTADAVELVDLRARVVELEHSLADAMAQIEAIQGSNAVHMDRVAELEASRGVLERDVLNTQRLVTHARLGANREHARVAGIEKRREDERTRNLKRECTLNRRLEERTKLMEKAEAQVLALREEVAGLLAAADADAFVIGNLNAHIRKLDTSAGAVTPDSPKVELPGPPE